MNSPMPPMISQSDKPDARIDAGNISEAYWRQMQYALVANILPNIADDILIYSISTKNSTKQLKVIVSKQFFVKLKDFYNFGIRISKDIPGGTKAQNMLEAPATRNAVNNVQRRPL